MKRSGALLGVVDREIACVVLPHRDVGKVRAAQERGELLRRILVRILGVDALPGGEHPLTAGDGDALCPARFEMHLDAACGGVVERYVRERFRIEVGAQKRIDVIEDVAVEGSGDSKRVIIGRSKPRLVLGCIDADKKPAAAIAELAYLGEQLERVVGSKIADAGAGIEERNRARVEICSQIERPRYRRR